MYHKFINIPMLIWVLSMLLHPLFVDGVPLYEPTLIKSQNVVLYQSNNLALGFRNFTIPFTKTFFNRPSVCFGLNHYHMRDKFYYENIFTTISSISVMNFQLRVEPGMGTNIAKIGIGWLATEDPGCFCLWRSYLHVKPSIVSTGQGSRTLIMQEWYNFSSSIIRGVPFLTGFLLQSITMYKLSISMKVGLGHFNISLSTEADCLLTKVDVSLFFYYPAIVIDQYLISCNSTYFSFPVVNQSSYSRTVSKAEISSWLLALNSFAGKTKNSLIQFGWSQTSLGEDLDLLINTDLLNSLNYSFIQIFSYTPPPQALRQNYLVDEGLSEEILLVVILLPTLLVLSAITILIIWRCRRRRLLGRFNTRINSSIGQLPSLAF